MKTKEVEVTDMHGKTVPADLVVCPSCGCEFFNVYVIGGSHLHFQCQDCDESFCDGSCLTSLS